MLITAGTLLGFGLRNGVESVNARLGADAMIVPQSAENSFEAALLGGYPSTFYLTTETANRILQIDGIERATAQLFISTFDSSHCSAFVQIIGYDPTTDFVVAPWLKESKTAEPGYGEIVIGGNLYGLGIGDVMQLFSVKLDVVGILDKTGMGFDNSVFVNMETAQTLLGEYEKYGAQPLPDGIGANDVVSALLLDFQNGTDTVAFQRSLNKEFRSEGVRYVSSQALLQSASKNLGLATGILTALLIAIWILSVFLLAIIFTLALNERRREFGILRAMGATRRKLTRIALCEATILCGVGALIGIAGVCLIAFHFGARMANVLQAAYLPPNSAVFAILLAGCFALGAIIGPVASLFSAVRIGKNETFANMREEL
jgi:putative ABC transport system permease protein